MIISIVGKSGSGKSTISKILSLYSTNFVALNIDEVGHWVLTFDEVKKELVKAFGEDVIDNNKVDRKILGDLVFNYYKSMNILTDITWNYMERYIDNFIEDNKDKIIILDWILLTRTKYFDKSDIKILIDAPFDIRMERCLKRDNITKDKFIERESASPKLDHSLFDYVIINENFIKTEEEVKKIYDKSIIPR